MEEKDIIKEIIAELLKKMNISGSVLVENFENDIIANIQTEEAGFLIGQAGKNLEAFQYLSRTLVNKKNEQSIQFIVDVNNYRKDRIESLRSLAKNIAKQTLTEKVSIIKVAEKPPTQTILLLRRKDRVLSKHAFTLYEIIKKIGNSQLSRT